MIGSVKNLLGSSPVLHQIFKNYRMINPHKRYPNLGDILVRANFQDNLTSNHYQVHNQVADYAPTSVKTTMHIRNHTIKEPFNCNSTNLVYIITCDKCPTFYIRKTVRRLGDLMSNHLRSIAKNEQDNPVAQHFNP